MVSVFQSEFKGVLKSFRIPVPSDFDRVFDACDLQKEGGIHYLDFVAAALPEAAYKHVGQLP